MNPVRYLMLLTVCLSAAPLFAADLASPDFTIEQVIDWYVQARLSERQIQPPPTADDGTFVRRACLDLQGRIPTPSEAKSFVESTESDKRQKLVDRMLTSPDFAYQFRNQLDSLLMKSNNG